MTPKHNIIINLQEEVWHSMRNQLTVPLMVFGHRFTKSSLKSVYDAYKSQFMSHYIESSEAYTYKMTFTHSGIL